MDSQLHVDTMGHNDGIEVPPRCELAPYIQCFWYHSGEQSQMTTMNNRALADGVADIVFIRWMKDESLGIKRDYYFSHVMGPRTKYSDLTIPNNVQMMGIRFRPGCTGSFLGGVPMHELTDQSVELNAIWGDHVKDIETNIWSIESNVERIQYLEEIFSEKLDEARLPDIITKEALLSIRCFVSKSPIAAIAEHCGISDRQLERKVKQYVGMSPKKYARITRVRQLIPLLHEPSPPKLADLAHFGGFADQGHFSREFKEVTGLSPKIYSKNANNVGFIQYDAHGRW